MFEQLMQLPLFQGASLEQITAIAEKYPLHFLKFADGETIVNTGDCCDHVRFIISGSVTVSVSSSIRQLRFEHTLNAPEVMGAGYLFGLDNTYPYTATAKGACGILQLRKSDYVTILQSDRVFLFNILNYLSIAKQKRVLSLKMITKANIAERLAMTVATLTTQSSTDITLHYCQKDLCSLLGVHRNTLVTTLQHLADEGLIEYTADQIRFIAPRRLFELLK